MRAVGPPASDLSEPNQIQRKYEVLRMAALGEPLPPECRRGLALFLRRGMWGWGRTLSSETLPATSPPRSPHESTPALQDRTTVRILAAMVMAGNDGEEQ
jgi:hypothetical protein